LGFQFLLDRLRDVIRVRVKNGQMTERNLARLTGTSQPHLHNVLKGIRVLTPELADHLLTHLNLSVQDLQEPDPSPPGKSLLESVSAILPLRDLESPAATYLDSDSRMAPRFQQGDLVFFEESVSARTELDSRAAYLVNYEGKLLVRYIRWGGKRLYLVAEDSLTDPLRWDFVFLTDGNILEIVRGRIVWICRQLET
jgi:transcriptional regulator with XRE-family HTH domain